MKLSYYCCLTAMMSVMACMMGPLVHAQSGSARYDQYLNPREINEVLKTLNQKYPGTTRLINLATTPGGTPLLLIEISNEAGNPKTTPAILVAANMEGTVPLSSMGALVLANLVLEKKEACDDLAWYIIPCGNPDAAFRYFSKPLCMDPRNGTPFNEDLDDLTDEDGFNDLDGNGIITQMRVKDPQGEWMVTEDDPQMMKRADPFKGEKGVYKLYTEGIDDDSDGQYNEDPPGGTNVGINFPHLFKHETETGGLWPGSAPEAFGIMKYVYEHPEIAMAFTFGSTDFCRVPPRGGRRGSVNLNEIKIPERFARVFNADPEKTYTMAEIMDLLRPMMPEGMEVSESMIAGFLGLGAVINPLEEDLKFYNELSEKYKEYLKSKNFDAKRLDPEPDKDGSIELWAYYHLGIPSFSMNLFTLPEPPEEKKESSGITVEMLEKMSTEEFIALDPGKVTLFMKEVGAPPQFKAEQVIEMVKSGQMALAQIASMIKQMPKPQAAGKDGDPKTKALRVFSNQHLGGKGFVEWKPTKHPTLGDVEIGGAVPFTDNTPPPSMIDSLLNIQVPYVLALADKLPRLAILTTRVTSKGAGVFELEAWVENKGYLPFPTAMGDRNKQPAPAVVEIDVTGATLLSGRKRTTLNRIQGNGAEKISWLLQTEKPVDITIRLMSKSAGNDQKTVKTGGVK